MKQPEYNLLAKVTEPVDGFGANKTFKPGKLYKAKMSRCGSGFDIVLMQYEGIIAFTKEDKRVQMLPAHMIAKINKLNAGGNRAYR